ncbi:unnamed protein product, partial [Closterium sp. Naga37s-1]
MDLRSWNGSNLSPPLPTLPPHTRSPRADGAARSMGQLHGPAVVERQQPLSPPPPSLYLPSACSFRLPPVPALMELRAAWGSYMDLRSWNGSNPCSRWWLVTCWSNGLLRRMDVSSKGIKGTLPSVLGNLTSLEELIATTNWIHGDIPNSFSNLVNLKNL